MPFPIALAAGLGTVIGSASAAVVGWLSAVMTKKAAVATAFAAFLVAGWVALQAAMIAAWAAVGWVIPAQMVVPLNFVVYLLPSNTVICVQALVLAKIGRWVWDAQREWAAAVAAA